ncbi:MAG: hypothetical protein AB4368_04725 [Xenococcaceae cyanobacterium]
METGIVGVNSPRTSEVARGELGSPLQDRCHGEPYNGSPVSSSMGVKKLIAKSLWLDR